jgi:26S proteasome regulatory subunit N3
MSSGVKELSPELDIFCQLLVLLYFNDSKQVAKGLDLSIETISALQNYNRRSLDALGGRVCFYYARFHELSGKIKDIRGILLGIHRKATLRHDEQTQSTVLNLLLKSYIDENLYDQADKLISKSNFPESADNNQSARYMYYQGRIKAVQLEYTASHQFLMQAVRKAPQTPATAGFQQIVSL